MIAYDPAAWVNLLEAVASSAAALAGLIFVAVSINLRAILEGPLLPLRAAEALLVLMSLVLLAILLLVPGQGRIVVGVELTVLAGGLLVALVLGGGYRRRNRRVGQPRHWTLVPLAIMLLSSIPLGVAGISTLAGAGGGLYWLVPELVFGYAGSVYDSWILLVEILR